MHLFVIELKPLKDDANLSKYFGDSPGELLLFGQRGEDFKVTRTPFLVSASESVCLYFASRTRFPVAQFKHMLGPCPAPVEWTLPCAYSLF